MEEKQRSEKKDSKEERTCPLARAGLLANPHMWEVITDTGKRKDEEVTVINRIIAYTKCEGEFCHLWEEADEYAQAGCTLKTIYKGPDV